MHPADPKARFMSDTKQVLNLTRFVAVVRSDVGPIGPESTDLLADRPGKFAGLLFRHVHWVPGPIQPLA